MSLLASSCSQVTASSRPRTSSRRSSVRVLAAIWIPSQQQPSDAAGKGRDRPWIEANGGQPILAPRTQDMAGDPFGLLLRQRIVFLGGEVEDFGADALVSQLLLLDNQDATKDIKLFINSPGGSVTAGMGIYDAMMLCRADVQTYCFGLAASMGAFLLGAGRRGKRHSMPNSRIMIHQPLGGASGQAVDIEIQAKEIMYHKANLNRIMADYTSQPLAKIEEDTDRDRYMSPIEAREYGIIDHVIGGDEAVFQIKGSNKRFPAVKESYVTDAQDLGKRSVMDGDAFMAQSSPSWRFRSRETEPFMPSQSKGLPWFSVNKVTKEQYKEMIERRRADLPPPPLRPDSGSVAAAEGDAPTTPRMTPRSAWMQTGAMSPSPRRHKRLGFHSAACFGLATALGSLSAAAVQWQA
ncbi:Clp protease-domain-containing protein [Scenedesmus sp. NREL 46B-D3]|nr:Clp protease-domain-containing protein [Scenedesmus sp. NREL 46B-D3]